MYRSNIDPEKKQELIEKVKSIVDEFDMPRHHKDTFEDMFYSVSKAASLYHLEKWELLSVAKAIQEMVGSLEMFAAYRDDPKVSIFGSARTDPEDEEFKLAMKFGQLIREAGYYVITGAGPGIMEAGHAGAGREYSFGLNIKLPFEQSSNPIIDGDLKDFSFRYFHTRKLMFIKESQALVACPGGYGTMDELYETLTLIQNGKSPIVPVVLLNAPGNDFWKQWTDFADKQFIGKNLISEHDRSLYCIKHTAEEARDEILNFYKNFDSYRYWKEEVLIMRIKKELSTSEVSKLSKMFGDIMVDGKVHKIDQQPFFDKGVEKYKNIHYLGLNFNLRDFGALRQLIDEINKL